MLQLPWLPGQLFNFNGATPSGPARGVGLVSADGSFFAYQLTPTDGRKFVLFGGTPTAKANFPTAGIGAQQLVNLTHPGDLPFAPTSVGSDPQLKAAANTSPLYTLYTPNTGSVPAGQGAPTGLQVTVSIAGSGAAQKSYMGVFIANYGTDYATNSIDSTGNYVASYRLGSDRTIGRATSSQATAATGQGNAIYGDTGQYMVYTPGKIETSNHRQTTTRVDQAALNQPSANSRSDSYYPVTVAAPAEAAAISPTIGQTRTSQTLTGYVGGLVELDDRGRTSTSCANRSSEPADGRLDHDRCGQQSGNGHASSCAASTARCSGHRQAAARRHLRAARCDQRVHRQQDLRHGHDQRSVAPVDACERVIIPPASRTAPCWRAPARRRLPCLAIPAAPANF